MPSPAPPCPLCGGDSRHALTAGDRNRELTRERFVYNRCRSCASVFMVDPPDDMARYYVGAYHGFGADGEPEWRENPTLLEVERFRAQTLSELAGTGPLIDIGAGAGGFAAAAAHAGFDVSAIEMDARCCAYMSDRLAVNAVCSDDPIAALSELPPARVISMWHSLEHLRDPAKMLAAAAARLQPGGVLALGVPNPGSLQFRLLRTRWAHLDAPRHLCLMPEDALVSHLQSLGLARLDAMTGDPFGVICSIHGWTYALRRRPARGESAKITIHAGRLLTRALGPFENARRDGAALTLLAVKRV
ncbi:MAG TPA: methyltransferase domain-containing protein [Solirubrobacteraceae bacterium]|jgi:SAM-dependent methyltransferase